MKTTLDIHDTLLQRAKQLSRNSGRPLRALVEDGLRRVLEDSGKHRTYRLPDCSVGKSGDPNPLEDFAWHELRDEIYGGK